MEFRKVRRQDISIDLTPLIDVVFLLLIFFVVSTRFINDAMLRIELPKAKISQVMRRDDPVIEVTIDARGSLAVNERTLERASVEGLMRALDRLSDAERDEKVVVRADQRTEHRFVVLALDALQRLGFRQVSIQVQNTDQPSGGSGENRQNRHREP